MPSRSRTTRTKVQHLSGRLRNVPSLNTNRTAARTDPRFHRYVARQPILTAGEKVFGYELLFRNGVDDYFTAADADSASRSTLDSSILIGLDVLCDGRQAFVNCTREVLLKDYITLLPPDQIAVDFQSLDGWSSASPIIRFTSNGKIARTIMNCCRLRGTA